MHMQYSKYLSFFIFTIMLGVLIPTAFAQNVTPPSHDTSSYDEFDMVVFRQLLNIEETYENHGFMRVGQITMSNLGLDEDEMMSNSYQFEAGYEYAIFSACDNDCDDIDTWLYNSNGTEVDEDMSGDDIPLVNVLVANSGRYTLKTEMYGCDTEPCSVGHIVLRKRS